VPDGWPARILVDLNDRYTEVRDDQASHAASLILPSVQQLIAGARPPIAAPARAS
jgi:hypothetical protein